MAILNFPNAAGQPTDGSFTYEDNGVLYSWDGYKWTANSEPGYDTRYVEVTGDTMTGDLTVPSLNGGQLAGFRNQIINGNFEIAQRGIGPFTSQNEYTLDRWKTRDNAGSPVNVTRMNIDLPGHPYALRYKATAGTVSGGVDTFIELPSGYTNGQFSPGSTWTLSYWSNKPLSNAIQAQDSSSAEGTPNRATGGTVEVLDTYNTFTRYSQTFTMPLTPFTNTKTCLKVVFTQGVLPADFILTGVQLEPGPVASVFEIRPIGLELNLCQRYYESGTYYGQSGGATSGAWGDTINFTARKRVNPTNQFYNNTGSVSGQDSARADSIGFYGTPNTGGEIKFSWNADAEL